MSQKDVLLTCLLQRKEELETAIKKAQSKIDTSISGYIEVNKNRNHYRYYYKEAKGKSGQVESNQTESDQVESGQVESNQVESNQAESNQVERNISDHSRRKYINDMRLVCRIVGNDYATIVAQKGKRELKQIEALIKTYENVVVDDIYKNMHPGRQALVAPIILDDDRYAELWLSNAEKQRQCNLVKSQNTFPNQFPILTENQETVRSKSEKIIADKLKLSNVPYLYEQALRLGNTTKYPDFTVLNKRTRKVFYWEHMGLIDQEEYSGKALSKLAIYSQNGIWPGKNLIVTYETKEYPLDVKHIERIIAEYLI